MGIEIVFVLILPVAVFCLVFTVWLWSRVAKTEWGVEKNGLLKAYAPLCAGFAVSMVGLAFNTYLECYADFTYLIQQGYYAEAQRAVYLPRRVIGQAVVDLIFLLPVISFVVAPMTVWLIRRDRLTFKIIGLIAIFGWFALSILGWLINLASITPPYSLPSFLAATVVPVVLYGMPIPIAAIWLIPSKSRP